MQKGFTLIELMMVVAIIAILASIAYPNYQDYVVRTKRADMMTEMQNIARELETRKLAAGRSGYGGVKTDGLDGNYPKGSNPVYTVSFTTITNKGQADRARDNNKWSKGQWQIIATPLSVNVRQTKDGVLTLDYRGVKCRQQKCGTDKEWNEN